MRGSPRGLNQTPMVLRGEDFATTVPDPIPPTHPNSPGRRASRPARVSRAGCNDCIENAAAVGL